MIWRHTGIGICRTCRSSSVVPYVARKEKFAAPQETVFKAVQPPLSEDKDRVRCPECLELVLNGAKKCKHCGSHLSAGSDGVLKVAHGDLGSIGVFDWWLSAFTAEEKEYIKGKFKPMGGLVDGESSINQCAHIYLESMQSHFRDKKDEVVFLKLMKKSN